MPRVKEATNVKAWRMEELIRDLAVGEKSYAELAEEHGVEEQTIRVFRMRHKADIQAVLAGWANTYDHIWSTKLENHVRVLTERWQKIMGRWSYWRNTLNGRRKRSGVWIQRPLRCRITVASTWRRACRWISVRDFGAFRHLGVHRSHQFCTDHYSSPQTRGDPTSGRAAGSRSGSAIAYGPVLAC
jgi:hypothetical protein